MTAAALQLLSTFGLLFAAAAPRSVQSATTTTFIDIRRTEKQGSESTYRNTFEFRIEATTSDFAPDPPMAPESATRVPMSEWHDESSLVNIGEINTNDKNSEALNAHGSNKSLKITHPAHQLTLSPANDEFLCKEAKGQADYSDGTKTGNIFDTYGTLITNDFPMDKYLLVPRGHCTFEAKARSAQRLGARGIIIYNTLDSRYTLKDTKKGTDQNVDMFGYYEPHMIPDWGNTVWPRNRLDYECGEVMADGKYHPKKAGIRAEIDLSELDFDPSPYDAEKNDAKLTGTSIDGSLCAAFVGDDTLFVKRCPSRRCLLTGKNATIDGSKLEACCAWDTPVKMNGDGDDDGDSVPQEKEEKIVIPTLFVTMESGDQLLELVSDAEMGDNSAVAEYISIVPYARWHPSVHFAQFFLWIIASVTLWFACYASSKEYRSSWKKIALALNEGVLMFNRSASNSNAPAEATEGRERAETEDTVELADDLGDLVVDGAVEDDLHLETEMTTMEQESDKEDDGNNAPAVEESDSNEGDFVGNSSNAASSADAEQANGEQDNGDQNGLDQGAQRQPHSVNLQSNSTTAALHRKEIQAYHYILLIVAILVCLFILWFFGLYNIVTLVFGIGGAHLMASYIFRPLTEMAVSKCFGKDASENLDKTAFNNPFNFKWIDIGSWAYGYAFAIAWIVVGFSYVQPLNNTYYWIMQDVMCVLYCIYFLTKLELNSAMIPVVTMLMVFVYTIFYAILARDRLLGSSILVDITRNAGTGMWADYCDNYHWDPACLGSQSPLPLLIALPLPRDFRGGFAMIGLGEIIVPGLLISFAARYDAARMLVKKCSRTSRSVNTPPQEFDSDQQVTKVHYYLGRVKKALFKGYFGPLIITYTLTLLAAYLVEYMTGVAQATLLYLVPACLGVTGFIGSLRRELSELWIGPRILTKANRMVAVAEKIPEYRSEAAVEANNNLADTTSVA